MVRVFITQTSNKASQQDILDNHHQPMQNKILVASIFENKEFESEARSQGLTALGQLAAEVRGYTNDRFTGRDAPGIAGISAESAIRLDRQTFEQVTDAIQGREPKNVLNPEVLNHQRVRNFLRHKKTAEHKNT